MPLGAVSAQSGQTSRRMDCDHWKPPPRTVAKAINYMFTRWSSFVRLPEDDRIALCSPAPSARPEVMVVPGVRARSRSSGLDVYAHWDLQAQRRRSSRGSPTSSPALQINLRIVSTNSCPGTGRSHGSVAISWHDCRRRCTHQTLVEKTRRQKATADLIRCPQRSVTLVGRTAQIAVLDCACARAPGSQARH